jgi:hypothetical protein
LTKFRVFSTQNNRSASERTFETSEPLGSKRTDNRSDYLLSDRTQLTTGGSFARDIQSKTTDAQSSLNVDCRKPLKMEFNFGFGKHSKQTCKISASD